MQWQKKNDTPNSISQVFDGAPPLSQEQNQAPSDVGRIDRHTVAFSITHNEAMYLYVDLHIYIKYSERLKYFYFLYHLILPLLILLLLDGGGRGFHHVRLLLELLGEFTLQRGKSGRCVSRRAVRHGISDVAVHEPR